MNFNGWTGFEDFARACGYSNLNNNSNNSKDNTQNNNNNNNGCCDIPNGFQSLNPELFVIIGTLLGEIIAGNLPSNVQNSIGNWFSLIGQVIMTYNAQQQYFEGGPGDCFNPKNFNTSNSSCSNNTTSNSSNNNQSSNKDKIEELENKINNLIKEIKEIKNNI